MTANQRHLGFVFLSLIVSHSILPTRVNDPRRPASPWGSKFDIEYSGFINMKNFFDTRQIIGDQVGNIVLYPAPKRPDPLGKDINHQGQFHSLAVETRFRTDMRGPNIGRATSQAAIECDFLGVPDLINFYRMRQAYFVIGFPHFAFLAGHFWHPMFAVECAPDQLTVDDGTPIAIDNRSPQLRFIFHPNAYVDCDITLASQFYFLSNGPLGFNSEYARDSMTPNVNFRIQVKKDENILGGSIDFKRLRPRLASNTNYKVNEIFTSVAGTVFGTYRWDEWFSTKLAVVAGQNMTNFRVLGGYAVHSIEPITDKRTYVNLASLGIWSELIYTTSCLEPALFIGWIKNLGAQKSVIPSIVGPDGFIEPLIYGFYVNNADTVFRAAPRIRFFFDPLTVGIETEYTATGYGIIERFGTVNPTQPTWNLRLMVALFYYF